ncbi:hypothetical protein N9B82_00330 [Saprospiraceae bacterium]|nr:hypothetical protein [Saprospiraceae bacterium]
MRTLKIIFLLLTSVLISQVNGQSNEFFADLFQKLNNNFPNEVDFSSELQESAGIKIYGFKESSNLKEDWVYMQNEQSFQVLTFIGSPTDATAEANEEMRQKLISQLNSYPIEAEGMLIKLHKSENQNLYRIQSTQKALGYIEIRKIGQESFMILYPPMESSFVESEMIRILDEATNDFKGVTTKPSVKKEEEGLLFVESKYLNANRVLLSETQDPLFMMLAYEMSDIRILFDHLYLTYSKKFKLTKELEDETQDKLSTYITYNGNEYTLIIRQIELKSYLSISSARKQKSTETNELDNFYRIEEDYSNMSLKEQASKLAQALSRKHYSFRKYNFESKQGSGQEGIPDVAYFDVEANTTYNIIVLSENCSNIKVVARKNRKNIIISSGYELTNGKSISGSQYTVHSDNDERMELDYWQRCVPHPRDLRLFVFRPENEKEKAQRIENEKNPRTWVHAGVKISKNEETGNFVVYKIIPNSLLSLRKEVYVGLELLKIDKMVCSEESYSTVDILLNGFQQSSKKTLRFRDPKTQEEFDVYVEF